MICPVCKRDLAPTLSICLTCGAMINDTVREELETKISRTSDVVASNSGKLATPKLPSADAAPKIDVVADTPPKIEPQKPAPSAPKKPPMNTRFSTGDLRVKKTSPTLVEFQTKKATVPEWRLQLQNSVRQKVGTNRRDAAPETPNTETQKPRATSGANALKVEFVEEEQPAKHQNPRVANALKRIEESRRAFSNQPIPEQSVQVGKATPRNYPFNVVARSNEAPGKPAPPPKATVNPSPKPMLVSPLKIEKRGFDTNKLPPVPQKPEAGRAFIPAAKQPSPRTAPEQVSVEEQTIENEGLGLEPETEEIDDLAPLSMRFCASLFDMIIGVFGSLILLSPFIISGGSWISLSGFFAVTAASAIVLFLYLTISIAFVGRSFGMRLFSLELVDIEENAYPTMHQAAVSSAVFLLSLAFVGIGFLPIFFNEERRAAHDILSGTILLREF